MNNMLRYGAGILFLGWVAAAQAAPPSEDIFTPRLDLLTVPYAYSGTHSLPSFRIGASVVFGHAPGTLPGIPESYNISPFPSVAKLQQEIDLSTKAAGQQAFASEHISLSRIFRIEFKASQINFTVKAHSALIEGKQFKVILQPQSTSLIWSKVF